MQQKHTYTLIERITGGGANQATFSSAAEARSQLDEWEHRTPAAEPKTKARAKTPVKSVAKRRH